MESTSRASFAAMERSLRFGFSSGPPNFTSTTFHDNIVVVYGIAMMERRITEVLLTAAAESSMRNTKSQRPEPWEYSWHESHIADIQRKCVR